MEEEALGFGQISVNPLTLIANMPAAVQIGP
jgi:hypothetical protein